MIDSTNPETIAAPLVALGASYLLYAVLGPRYLDADDDWWPGLRAWALPKLDAIGSRFGHYAERESYPREYAATIHTDVDAVEETLEAMGYRRNPLAALKERYSPVHQLSAGSWARRYGGRTDVTATRQVHVTLYDGADGVDCYPHDEYNSLNPVTAWRHYRGKGQDVDAGREAFVGDLRRAGVDFTADSDLELRA